jgi:hypothetical protein
MGVAFDQNGDYANARAAYQQALAVKPGDVGTLNNYALSRMQAKDLTGARQLMAQASAGGASDPKIAQNAALLASLAAAPSSVPAAAVKTAPAQQASVKPVTSHQAPPVSLGPNVVVQSVPKDPQAGPVKQATAAPHKLAPDALEAKKPAASTATIRPTVAPAPHKVAETAMAANKKPSADKTPSLRMTADVSTP